MFLNHIKNIVAGMSTLINKLPDKRTICKNSKGAAILCSIALAGKLCHVLITKYGKKAVIASVNEKKNEAIPEIIISVNKELGKFVFECVFRWISYLSLIILAHITVKSFGLNNDTIVAFSILCIYSFYVIKLARICRWYISFCKINGLMFNPIKIIKTYLNKAILDEVGRTINGLSLLQKFALNFFGPKSDEIARDLTNCSMNSNDLRKSVICRIGMLILGWIIYLLFYEKLFLLVTNIDFKAFWEPIVWPFHILVKIML